MKYDVTLEVFHSKIDRAGNCYYAFTWTRHDTGAQVSGTVSGSELNITSIPWHFYGGSHEPHDVLITVTPMNIRPFDRMVKPWPYAGCASAELWEFIRKQIYPERAK